MIADVKDLRKGKTGFGGNRFLPAIPADSPLAKTGSLLPPWFGHAFQRVQVSPPINFVLTQADLLSAGILKANQRPINLNLGAGQDETPAGVGIFGNRMFSMNILGSAPDPLDDKLDSIREQSSSQESDAHSESQFFTFKSFKAVLPNAEARILQEITVRDATIGGTPPTTLDLLHPFKLGAALFSAVIKKSPQEILRHMISFGQKRDSRLEFNPYVELEPVFNNAVVTKKFDRSQAEFGLSVKWYLFGSGKK